MKHDRLAKVEDYIKQRDFVSMDELCNIFGRSINTIRRDVSELTNEGRIEKVYGGVRPLKSTKNPIVSFSERLSRFAPEKKHIGKLAAEYVSDGDIIFLDSGTTTVNIIPNLSEHSDITIITNNLYVITECMEYPNLNTISLGGQLCLETASFSSNYCDLDNLSHFNIKKAFMAATRVTVDKGATNTSPAEVAIKREAVERSDECFLLVDASKFGSAALLTYAPLDAFRCIITDAKPPDDCSAYFKANQIEVVM